VVALGGNALLKRGEAMSVTNQRSNVAVACEHLEPVAREHELVIAHGNGPQIGLLALEGAAYEHEVPAYPLDVLGAETQGMIGYLIQQDLGNRLGEDRRIATVLTRIAVDPADPAFASPSKPIGPIYSADEAAKLEKERGWTFKSDGNSMRRVVPSPAPRKILEFAEIAALLSAERVVICAGGGGIPVATDDDGRHRGVEAVIDKDLASALLAHDLEADALVMATDARAAFLGFATKDQRAIVTANPEAILSEHASEFAAGSMLPKVEAACKFARQSGKTAVIGELAQIEGLVRGVSGTRISMEFNGVVTEKST
jgi:carbamate kinase